MKSSVLSDPFVGREREMEQLTQALERAVAGHGQMIMLVGEPGVGKTRTAQELVALARANEVVTLWGRCSEEHGAPPHWPWIQIIQSHIDDLGSEAARSVLASSAGPISTIMPGALDAVRGKDPF